MELKLTLQQAEELAGMLQDAKTNRVEVGELHNGRVCVKWDRSELAKAKATVDSLRLLPPTLGNAKKSRKAREQRDKLRAAALITVTITE